MRSMVAKEKWQKILTERPGERESGEQATLCDLSSGETHSDIHHGNHKSLAKEVEDGGNGPEQTCHIHHDNLPSAGGGGGRGERT